MVEFIVYGQPQRKQRPRFKRVGEYVSTYTPKQTLEYEEKIKSCYIEQVGGMLFKGQMPIRVSIDAYFKIPKSFSKKKKQLAIDGLLLPLNKMDVDNISKVFLDALNGVAYDDDRYVTNLKVIKRYSDIPRVEVRLSEVKIWQQEQLSGKTKEID